MLSGAMALHVWCGNDGLVCCLGCFRFDLTRMVSSPAARRVQGTSNKILLRIFALYCCILFLFEFLGLICG